MIQRSRLRLRALLAILATILAVAGVSVLTPTSPAQAASPQHAGGPWNPHGGWLGNYLNPDTGTRVYCIDYWTLALGSGGAGAIESTIVSAEGNYVGGTRTVSGDELRKLNYAVSTHGQTDDDFTAAAVAAYVWGKTSTAQFNGGLDYIRGPHAEAIRAMYHQIAADTEANFDSGTKSGSVKLRLKADPTNHYRATLEVSGMSPDNATGTLSLRNGVFRDTGLSTRDGVGNGMELPIRAVPPGDGRDFKIEVEGAFQGVGEAGYESNVRVHHDTEQRTVGPGVQFDGSAEFEVTGADDEPRSSTFQPVVSTRVASHLLREGEELVDVLQFSTAANASGVNNDWYRSPSGEYAIVQAEATIYGPFLDLPEETATPPADAPIAAQGIRVATSAKDGPTVDYPVHSGFRPSEPGYYTWVWHIAVENQPAGTRRFLAPGYEYTDRFGQLVETSLSPTSFEISTVASAAIASIGHAVTDSVTITPKGGWVRANGENVPATLTGRAYFSENVPELAETPPSDAEMLAEFTMVVNEPGSTQSEALTLPLKPGYVVFQWCLRESDQPEQFRGMLRPGCDLYGQPAETVQVVTPTVVTEAQPSAHVGEPIRDTAIVTGPVPENVEIEFELYSEHSREGHPVCEAENLVAHTVRVHVPAAEYEGERVESPEVTVSEPGTYWWVETLVHTDPESGEETVLHRGECGLEHETTVVSTPEPETAPEPKLAVTGAESAGVAAGAAAALMVLAGASVAGAGALSRRRTRKR